MDLSASKWKVAALTLVTLPAAIWYVAESPDTHILKLVVLLGISPLFVGAGAELYGQWKAVWDNWGDPRPQVLGSPTGSWAVQEDTKLLRIIRNAAFVIGTALLLPAFYLIGNSAILLTFGVSVQGRVEKVLPLSPSRTCGAPQILVEFATPDGQTIRFKDTADRMFSHEAGQVVDVLYDRKNPARAIVDKPVSLWLGAYHLILLGGALLVFTYLFHRAVNRAGQASRAQA